MNPSQLIIELFVLCLVLFESWPSLVRSEDFVPALGHLEASDGAVGLETGQRRSSRGITNKAGNVIGPKITWMPTKKLYLCDNYHFSVTTPNSYIYPKLEIKILESTLTQGFTIFLRCGNFATPYNYDTRIDIPSGISKGSVFDRKLPLCNFPLLDNNAYNIDIYIGDVDIEFTRRHYCPCSSQYVILSIGCLVEYNNNEIITLSPSSEYTINGPISSREKKEGVSEAVINSNSLPLNNLKIFSVPVCVVENDFVTACNAVLQFSIQMAEKAEKGNDGLMLDRISHNFCIYLSPYYWNPELLDAIRSKKGGQMSAGRSLLEDTRRGGAEGRGESLASIPAINDHLTSSLSPNICIDLKRDLSDSIITNENLPPQLRSNLDSIEIKLAGRDRMSPIDDTDPKMIRVHFVLNNIKPSKYFIYPFIYQYNTRSDIGLDASGKSNIDRFSMKFFYDLNYLQLTGDPFIVKWLSTRVSSNYNLDNVPKVIESDNLDFNVRLSEPFYVVIPRTRTNILSFERNNLVLYVSSELLYLFKEYNSSLIIDYIGLLGRFPISTGNEYNLVRDYELKETKIFNIASNPRIEEDSQMKIANISIPMTVSNNLPFTFRMKIMADTKSKETLPLKSINIRMKHQIVPTMCRETTCSGHGDCSLVKYSNNINIYCSCYPGWGGFYCSYPYLSSQSILAYPITLVGTNFVAIPTIFVCVFKKKWLVAFLAFVAGLVSSIFHAAEVGLLVDHEDILLKGDLISAQLIISFVFILLCRFNYKIEMSLLLSQIVILILLTLLTSRLVTTVIPLINCFTILFSRIIYWYSTTKLYSEKIPSEISCTIPIELTNTLNTPTHLISKESRSMGPDKEVELTSPTNSSVFTSNRAGINNCVPSNSTVSKTSEARSSHNIQQRPSPVQSLNLAIRNAGNLLRRLQDSALNSYRKLVFIFDREYYSPRHILIGFIMGAIGCITWFLETVDTYWFFHSIWHIMAFLASTFIVHGCVPPKIYILPSRSDELQFSKKATKVDATGNDVANYKTDSNGIVNVEL
ncbi:hypothetical protein OJ253_1822, partial [Cryptosporidium canis]